MVQPAASTLGDLVDTIGVGVLDVLAAPKGVDVDVAEAVIFDPGDPGVGGPGDLVLAVGIAEAEEGVGLLWRAGESGATAVVMKVRNPALTSALVAAAEASGVAVLMAAPEVSWAQLHSLVRTAVAAGGVREATRPGVPIGDLFGLANAVAAMVGGPVTIEDPRSTVLAYSSLADHEIDPPRRATILGRRVPDEWIERQQSEGVFRRLFREAGPVRVEFGDLDVKPRLAVAIRAGEEVLGSIWAQEGDRPLGDDAEAALAEAARMAALHLLRHNSSADLERARRAELVRAALEGRIGAESLASTLHVSPATPVSVVAVEIADAAGDHAAIAVEADRVAGIVSLYCESYRQRAAVVAIGSVVYAVVPHVERADRAWTSALATGMRERAAAALHLELRAAVGRTVDRFELLLESRREADRVLRALAESPQAGPVATIDTVRPRVLLQRLRELARNEPLLFEGKLDMLAESDRERGTEYVATLSAFFDALGEVPAAAAARGVHPNTFRYRLRRLCEVAGIDLDDPIERLVVALQLQLRDR